MIVQKELFGEDKHIEFKLEIPKKHEKFLKDIIAFANTSGGKIIVGVEDETGRVVGLGDHNPFKLSDAISNMISDACTPQIYSEITAKTVEGETILEVEVFPGPNRPYYLKTMGKERSAYVRMNGTSRPASEIRLKELEMEGMHMSYDTLWEIGCNYDAEDTQSLMESMYQTALSNSRSAEEKTGIYKLTVEKLEDFGIVRKEEGRFVPTRAFTLLTHPKERYVKIQCALFKGTDKVDFIDRKEFGGAIQGQIEEAHQFVLRHTNKGAVIDGLFRRDIYELPTTAIREIIANAVLHRSYVDPASIQVSIFDNRIEIDSPGMLYAGLTVAEAMSGKSKCRNKAIAEAFQYMKLIEGWGTGLPRLFKRCKEMGLPEPKFEEFGDGIKVTIYRGNRAVLKDSETNMDSYVGESVGEGVGDVGENVGNVGEKSKIDIDIKKIILQLIRDDNKISAADIAKTISVARRTVERHIKDLREEGVLIRRGSARGGIWEVVKKEA